MERKSYTVAVDLGTSNVVVTVGSRNAEGALDVECVVSKPVEGVRAGKIENIELVSNAIREAVSEVEARLGLRISEAYAGLSGDFVRCARHTDHVFVLDPQNGVCQRDVEALFDRMRNVQAPDDETIMERVPQNYVVDDNQEVKNPVGSFGRKLSSTFNFILCLKTPMQRLDMALKRLGIRMAGVFSNALVTPEAVLTPEEKEEGVAVVDVGGGVTDVTVYYHNVVRYIACIPMGATAINRDIRTMGVPERLVESLKLRYGSAVAELAPEDKLVRVNGRTARDAKDILLRNLATVIEARATDIAEFVAQEIKDSGYADRLACGIVLTGGSARLKDLDELFRRVTRMDVRVALPEAGITAESKEHVADPAFSTAVGILLKGSQTGACAVVEMPASHRTAPQPQPQPAASSEAAAPRTEPSARQPLRTMPRPAPQPQVPHAEPHPYHAPQSASHSVAAEPAPAETEPQQPRYDEEEPQQEPRRRRGGLGSLLQGALKKINESFGGPEDEDI